MKYIIELKDDVQVVQKVGVTENGNAFVMNFYKDQLEELTADYINEHFGDLQDTAYKKGLHDGESKCRYCNEYQKGFEDGKAQVERGCEGCKYEGRTSGEEPCFSCARNVNDYWTAKQTNDEIMVGDEVYCKDDDVSDSGVVTWAGKESVYAMWQDGSAGEAQKDELVKTGRHFDIASILEEMRHD